MDGITINGVLIKKLESAGLMVKSSDMVIYVDPSGLGDVKVPEDYMADMILITHEHFGHCDPDSIRKVRRSDCTTLIPENMSLQFRGDARRVMAGDSLAGELSIKGVDIEVLPAYDSCENGRSSGEGVGYFFTIGNLAIYHAGHTCDVADMSPLSPDLVVLPIGGGQVMDFKKAGDAAATLDPGYILPVCYGSDSGGNEYPTGFVDIVKEKIPSAEVLLF